VVVARSKIREKHRPTSSSNSGRIFWAMAQSGRKVYWCKQRSLALPPLELPKRSSRYYLPPLFLFFFVPEKFPGIILRA
jgi:hypothetical protein